jgi:hypothetical protein
MKTISRPAPTQMPWRVRHGEGGVLVETQRSTTAATIGGLTIGLVLPTVLAIGAFREGSTLVAAAFLLLAIVCLAGFARRLFGPPGCGRRLWIGDAATGAATVPDECRDAEVVLASDVSRIDVRYENPSLHPRNGWLEMLITFKGDSGPRLINQQSIWGYRRFASLANNLAERWCVPIVVDEHSMKHAKWGRGKYERFVVPFLASAILVFGIHTAYRQWNVRHWTNVPATVIRFNANERAAANGYAWYANPSIEYRYSVNGQTIRSSGLNPSPINYLSRDAFSADTADFRNGQVVPCWHNPRNAAEAFVVNVGITTDTLLVISAGLALLVAHFVSLRRMVGFATFEMHLRSGGMA